MKLDDLLGGLGRVSNSGIVRDPGLFSGTSFLRTLGGHRYDREIIRQIKDLVRKSEKNWSKQPI